MKLILSEMMILSLLSIQVMVGSDTNSHDKIEKSVIKINSKHVQDRKVVWSSKSRMCKIMNYERSEKLRAQSLKASSKQCDETLIRKLIKPNDEVLKDVSAFVKASLNHLQDDKAVLSSKPPIYKIINLQTK